MIPLRIVETDREGFEEPVVELWREDEFVGMVFWDGETTIVQIHPAADGDVHDLDADDLVRVLEMAEAIVDPEAFAAEGLVDLRAALAAEGDEEDGWEAEDPATLELVTEFDPQAEYRSEEGEGFFPPPVAAEFIRRCEELDLAVVEMEGFDIGTEEPVPRAGSALATGDEPVMTWDDFRSFANVRATDTLHDWMEDPPALVAFVVRLPDGATFVV